MRIRTLTAGSLAALVVASGVGATAAEAAHRNPAGPLYVGAKPVVTANQPVLSGSMRTGRLIGTVYTKIWAIQPGCVHQTQVRFQQLHLFNAGGKKPYYQWVDESYGRGSSATRDFGIKKGVWTQGAAPGRYRTLGRSWIWCDVDHDRQIDPSVDKFWATGWVPGKAVTFRRDGSAVGGRDDANCYVNVLTCTPPPGPIV